MARGVRQLGDAVRGVVLGAMVSKNQVIHLTFSLTGR